MQTALSLSSFADQEWRFGNTLSKAPDHQIRRINGAVSMLEAIVVKPDLMGWLLFSFVVTNAQLHPKLMSSASWWCRRSNLLCPLFGGIFGVSFQIKNCTHSWVLSRGDALQLIPKNPLQVRHFLCVSSMNLGKYCAHMFPLTPYVLITVASLLSSVALSLSCPY